MKTRYSTIDIRAAISELNSRFIGLRVANVYDIDHRTYLIRLARPDEKAMILLESGNKIHSTEFDWPKNMMPSGFSMKLRKHLRSRRLEKIEQLGIDRIIDLQFGSGEAAYHLILELYDRGNIVLTDHEFTIMNILRPRTDDSQDVRFAVREKYPIENAKQPTPFISQDRLKEIIENAKEGDYLKKILTPHFEYGPALVEHSLLTAGFTENLKIGVNFNIGIDLPKLYSALQIAEDLLQNSQNRTEECKGYIIQERRKKAEMASEGQELLTYKEFHPYLYKQHSDLPFIEHVDFNKAVDEFFSKIESQKLDVKALQQEKTALKKLDNVKKDHQKRLDILQKEQELDTMKGQLVEINLNLVDRAIMIVQSAIANQIDWTEISDIVKEATIQGDPVASSIKTLKLDTNEITMLLRDPYDDEIKPTKVQIQLNLSAYANARRYYDKKKHASVKEEKTIDASAKALKSAERKTKETLKDVQTAISINKTRKTYWFEKFLWCISSENYLIIGGRDQQQNELIVKRYLRPGDVYVHADLHGASSVIIKNPSGEPVTPKALNEAGTMAVCNSAAWEAKVVTSAWWVHHDQVSKTAPTGEYLTTGSFMIRGKKNYLPPCYLVYGFGFMFKLDEDSLFRHIGERRIKTAEEDTISEIGTLESEGTEISMDDDAADNTDDSDSESDDAVKVNLEPVQEEEISFPDTNISLQHVTGDKYQLQGYSDDKFHTDEQDVVYLGDNEPIHLSTVTEKVGHGKMSQKQRKNQKKGKKGDNQGGDEETGRENEELMEDGEKKNRNSGQQQQQQQQQAPLKRGQKAKMKKIKEKYKDQDEEERQLKMEILASARPQKEDKKKKGKKAMQQEQKQRRMANKPLYTRDSTPSERLQAITIDEAAIGEKESSAVEHPGSDDEKLDTVEDETLPTEELNMLDSFTGIPDVEDVLHYAIPVIAPYNTMTNYKFKVKLTPGTTKRGKAAKTALNMFTFDKSTTPREKDLLKIVKDNDISRNFPGKVKVSAPNLLRSKGKGKK
ncbi:ribosome quality control complex subunit NEMF-like [Tubulanus polymorphus]|uniref:ribosome quality control complex subunit NEMF-like n=1 Tax=Tubulanus polymorphus TaxID=672921 RepID=UPI003DA61294